MVKIGFLSGQCNDGSKGSKKMSIVVLGAYLTDCDCQTGAYVYPCFSTNKQDHASLCYDDAELYNCDIPGGDCEDCLEFVEPDGPQGLRIEQGQWPCDPTSYDKNDEESAHPCNNRGGRYSTETPPFPGGRGNKGYTTG